MKTNLNIGLQGHFTLVVSGPRGVRVYEAPNLILNTGLDRMFTGSAATGHIQIGTGNAAVTATDTQLQARVNSTSTVQTASAVTYVAGPPDYIEYTRTYRFVTGQLDSVASGNFAEIGHGWAATGSLLSRALITPGAISVLADEQLDVIYRFRVYPIQSDVTGSVTLDGTSYSYTIRPALVSDTSATLGAWTIDGLIDSNPFGGGLYSSSTGGTTGGSAARSMTAWTGAIGSRTGSPAGTAVGTVTSTASISAQTYTNGTFQRTKRYTWDLNDCNGTFRSIMLPMHCNSSNRGTPGLHQLDFGANITKLSTQRLRLDVTYSFANRP